MTNDLSSLFELVSEEKQKKKLEEERKKEEMDKLVGGVDIGSLFSQVTQSLKEDKKNQKEEAKTFENAFESWLSSSAEEKENIIKNYVHGITSVEQKVVVEEVVKPEPVKEVVEQLVEEVVVEPKVEPKEDLVEQSLGLLSEPSDEKMGDDPLTPLDKKFLTLEDLNKHYNVFLNRIQQQLSTVGGGGENNDDGWEYVSDGALESSPITLAQDTWTQLTNDGASGSTNRTNLPIDSGVTSIYNTSTNKIDLSQLTNKHHVIFRFGVKADPTVDNTTLKVRIYWTTTSGSNYSVEAPGALLNDGAGQVYEEQYTLPFYVGYDSTRLGSGIVQVKADAECEITDSAFLTIVG